MKIVRVSNDISPTNTAFNQFAKYRSTVQDAGIEKLIVYRGNRGTHNERMGPDVIECESSYLNLFKSLKKIVNQCDKYDEKVIIHHHYPKFAFILLLLKWIYGDVIHVYTIHNTYRNYRFIHKVLTRINMLLVDKVVYCGKASSESFKTLRFLPSSNKQMTITNGVDIQRVDNTTSKKENNTGKITLVTIAKVTNQKNIQFLIDVFENLPAEYQLEILGPLNDEDKNRIKNSEVTDRIFTRGRVEREEVYRKFKSSDIFLSAALWEGLPIAVLEAMACRIPVILSEIESHDEIKEKISSLKTTPFEVTNWVNEIEKLSKLDEIEKKAIAEKNRKGVETNYSLSSMHEKYTELYNSI